MTGTEWAAVIAATGTAVTTVLTALVVVLRKEVTQTREAVCEVKDDVVEVHKMVNQRATDAKAYEAKLIDALAKHGIKIPVDESVTPPDEGKPSAT